MKILMFSNLELGNKLMMTIYKEIITNIDIAHSSPLVIKIALETQVSRPVKVVL